MNIARKDKLHTIAGRNSENAAGEFSLACSLSNPICIRNLFIFSIRESAMFYSEVYSKVCHPSGAAV